MDPLAFKKWTQFLDFFHQPEWEALVVRIENKYAMEDVCPPRHQMFKAFQLTSPEATKVVILGQDPYHGVGQAHGLAFSVPPHVAVPPSLRNIFREVKSDVYPDSEYAADPDLTRWASQGVLLLNTALTVKSGQAGSHVGLGWTGLTSEVLSKLSLRFNNLVFMLWGNKAKALRHLIEKPDSHLILETSHPSPMSVRRGFDGCRHFSMANRYLESFDKSAIEW